MDGIVYFGNLIFWKRKSGFHCSDSRKEKKRFEILQMALLDPKIAVLDETDSGLDVDALRIVGKGVTNLKSKDRGMLVITHYQRLLDHIIPDFVHIMVKGKIIESGGPDLAKLVEKEGYKSFLNGN